MAKASFWNPISLMTSGMHLNSSGIRPSLNIFKVRAGKLLDSFT